MQWRIQFFEFRDICGKLAQNRVNILSINQYIWRIQLQIVIKISANMYQTYNSSSQMSEFTKKPNSKKTFDPLNYASVLQLFEDFIKNFENYRGNVRNEPAYEAYGRKKYMIKLQQIANYESNYFDVLYEDIAEYFRDEKYSPLLDMIRKNTKRYNEIFKFLSIKMLPNINIKLSEQDDMIQKFENALKEQRRDNILSLNPEELEENQQIPLDTYINHNVGIIFSQNNKLKSINEIQSQDMGSLITIKAIVVRASDVKPQISIATYACDVCGNQNYLPVKDKVFNPPTVCQSKRCKQNRVGGKLMFLPSHSKFISFQQLKIQQTPEQVKMGHVPASMTVHLKGQNVKSASPGDIVLIEGIVIPRQRMGFQHQYDLTFGRVIEAVTIIRQKKKYVDMKITQEMEYEIKKVRSNMGDEELYEKLASSIAPQIFGLHDVKKALLLMLAGGVTKQTDDNLKIRGQINVALFGDPGIAKSQLLKYIASLAPRGVYTTGKGSSGVGLTAAITQDPFTKQLMLQAGALVLADMGVCCIDQFDKMEEKDKTAIHEVMEQQTVSIAKAGITSTLNARTSVLAAANPSYGRYNRKESIYKNINMPAALLSRFDLIFILLDDHKKEADLQLAKHICSVHQNGKAPNAQNFFSMQFLRSYIAKAKAYNPKIGKNLHKIITQRYIQKRKSQLEMSQQGENFTTLRSLLAMIRISQAKARLRFSEEVTVSDFEQAMTLIQMSQNNLIQQRDYKKVKINDDASEIYEIIEQFCKYAPKKTASYDDIKSKVISKGFTEEALDIVITNYELLNIIAYNYRQGTVMLIEKIEAEKPVEVEKSSLSQMMEEM